MTQLTTRPHPVPRTKDDVELPRRRFTVDEYEQMIAAGIIREGERVQLIEGEIVRMAALGSPHAACVDRTAQWFMVRTVSRAQTRVQSPIRLPPRSEPEPDIVLLRPRDDFYASGHPRSEDVLLIVEVAHSSLSRDLRRKIPMHARAGIQEVWLVDLNAGTVIVHREPHAARYGWIAAHRRGVLLSPLALPDLAISVEEILGA